MAYALICIKESIFRELVNKQVLTEDGELNSESKVKVEEKNKLDLDNDSRIQRYNMLNKEWVNFEDKFKFTRKLKPK